MPPSNEDLANFFKSVPKLKATDIAPLLQTAYSSKTSVDDLHEQLKTQDPLLPDPLGRTALMLAAWNGGAAKTEALLARSDIRAKDEKGVTALMFAAGMGDPERVRLLLPYSDPLAADDDGLTAFMHALKGNKKQNMLALADASDFNAVAKHGQTLLMLALKVSPEMVGLMLSYSDINAQDEWGRTVLMHATEDATTAAMIPTLLKHGADPSFENQFGQNALMIAAHHDLSATKALSETSDINGADQFGTTVLMHAINHRKMTIAKGLIGMRVDVNARDQSGVTALAHSMASGDEDLARTLLEAGADLHAVDQHQQTVLMHSVDQFDSGMVKFLLERGADAMALDEEGLTALHRAMMRSAGDENDENDEDAWETRLELAQRMPLAVVKDAMRFYHGNWDQTENRVEDEAREAFQTMVRVRHEHEVLSLTTMAGTVLDTRPRQRL